MQNSIYEQDVLVIQNATYEQDFLITELPQPIKNLLQAANLPWLNSLEFCTGYDDSGAERVLLRRDSEKIHQAVFYRLTKKMGLLPIIEIVGFPDMDDAKIGGLIKTHHAQLAVVNRLEDSIKPDEEWQATQPNVYHHSYVTIAQLPPTKEEYLKRLGKHKRAQLPNYWRKLAKHLDTPIEIYCEWTTAIKLEDVVQLECLNRERRAGKGKRVDSVLDIQQRQQHNLPLTAASGLLVTLRYQGKIIGGTFNYVCGNEAFLILIGHDPVFEHLQIGSLGLWKTIEHLIDKGITQYNLLWGRQAYKTQFLGVEYPWSVHIISPYKWLAIVWKKQIKFNQFPKRAWRFVKERLGFLC